MFVIGAILIVLAIIVVIYVTFSTRSLEPLTIDWGPFTAALTPLQLFFLGAVTILVLAIGAVMFSLGLKSQGAKRAEVKQLRKEVKAVHADPSRSTDDAKGGKNTPHDSSESARPGRDDSRDGDGAGSSFGSPSSGSSTGQSGSRTPTTSTPTAGPTLPPPVPPRDGTPPRTSNL